MFRRASSLVSSSSMRSFSSFTTAPVSKRGVTMIGVGLLGSALWMGNNRYFANSAEDIALSPDEFREFRLQSVEYYNHNTNIFRVAFPQKDQKSGLTTASFVLVQGVDKEGKTVARPYTPISTLDTTGHTDLLIKQYPEGNVSKQIHQLHVGDTVSMKGPFKKMTYTPNMKKEIGMVAGGTGITPMMQVVETIFDNKEDNTNVSLIFANVKEEDILCREWIEEVKKNNPDRFNVYYTLDKPEENWTGGKGFITVDMVKENLPAPSTDTLILFCGPPPMLKAVAGPKGKNWTQGEVGGVLEKLGYTTDMVYKF